MNHRDRKNEKWSVFNQQQEELQRKKSSAKGGNGFGLKEFDGMVDASAVGHYRKDSTKAMGGQAKFGAVLPFSS